MFNTHFGVGGGGSVKCFVITSGGLETFYSGVQGGMNFLWIICIYPPPRGSRYFLTSPQVTCIQCLSFVDHGLQILKSIYW